MNKEAYVSFETAKLLKDKGFDWGCNGHWYIGEHKTFEISSSTNPINWNEVKTDLDWLSCPTQQMACDWLTEEKNIYVTAVPDIGNSLRFYPAIYVIKGEMTEEYWFEYINSVVEELHKSYGKPQQAVKAALEYVLTNLI